MYRKVVAAALIVAFALGFSVEHYRLTVKIERIENDHLTALNEAKENARKELEARELENSETVSNLLARLDNARVNERSLNQRVERLRSQLSSGGVSADSAAPGGITEKRLAQCERLLSEGLGLGAEGSGLCERIAVRKDAVVKWRK